MKSALARYRQMLRALHERGIRPFVTLHHFTNPQWFEDKGAFAAHESVALFQRFTQRVVGALGDLCRDWATFNEPNVYVSMGYFLGEFPPGKKGRFMQAAHVTQNLCLAHAAAYRTIHALQADANVGWAQHYVVFKPLRPESAVDRWLCGFTHRRFNDNFAEGIRSGQAPFPLNKFGRSLPEVKGTCDFVGINYYSRLRVGFDLRSAKTLFLQISVPPHKPQGDSGIEVPYGEVYPEGLQRAVEHFAGFKKPIYILENGVPDREDRIRPWAIESIVSQMRALLAEGVDLRGYFHWTLADNFEWNEGWHLRFGLFELDPVTQIRKPRPSAKVYAGLISKSMGRGGTGVLDGRGRHIQEWHTAEPYLACPARARIDPLFAANGTARTRRIKTRQFQQCKALGVFFASGFMQDHNFIRRFLLNHTTPKIRSAGTLWNNSNLVRRLDNSHAFSPSGRKKEINFASIRLLNACSGEGNVKNMLKSWVGCGIRRRNHFAVSR